MCNNQCASNNSASDTDVNVLRAALTEAKDRNPGMTLLAVAPHIENLLAQLEPKSKRCGGGCGGGCSKAAVTVETAANPVVVRRIKTRKDDGPISGASITERMVQICGCQGQYDCDCVSVENQARRELWTEHNAAL